MSVVTQPGRVLHGIAAGVTPEGALVVKLADGREETIWVGDIETLRPAAPSFESHGGLAARW